MSLVSIGESERATDELFNDNINLTSFISPDNNDAEQAELDEIDIDLDELLDMEDDDTRRHWLQVSSMVQSSFHHLTVA